MNSPAKTTSYSIESWSNIFNLETPNTLPLPSLNESQWSFYNTKVTGNKKRTLFGQERKTSEALQFYMINQSNLMRELLSKAKISWIDSYQADSKTN